MTSPNNPQDFSSRGQSVCRQAGNCVKTAAAGAYPALHVRLDELAAENFCLTQELAGLRTASRLAEMAEAENIALIQKVAWLTARGEIVGEAGDEPPLTPGAAIFAFVLVVAICSALAFFAGAWIF